MTDLKREMKTLDKIIIRVKCPVCDGKRRIHNSVIAGDDCIFCTLKGDVPTVLSDQTKEDIIQWARENAFNCIGKKKDKPLGLPAITEGFIDGYNQHYAEMGAEIIKRFRE